VKKQLSRGQVMNYFANLPACRVGLETCAVAHHFARAFTRFGHTVRLIPPQDVKAYVRGQKTDYNDARAIAEAVRVPQMRFAAVKTSYGQVWRMKSYRRRAAGRCCCP
jgi:transposase